MGLPLALNRIIKLKKKAVWVGEGEVERVYHWWPPNSVGIHGWQIIDMLDTY